MATTKKTTATADVITLLKQNIRTLIHTASVIRDQAIEYGYTRPEAVEVSKEWFLAVCVSVPSAKRSTRSDELAKEVLANLRLKTQG